MIHLCIVHTNRVPEVTIHHTEKIGKIVLLSTQFIDVWHPIYT